MSCQLKSSLIQKNCPDISEKDEWPPNLPDLNPVDYQKKSGAQCWNADRYTPTLPSFVYSVE